MPPHFAQQFFCCTSVSHHLSDLPLDRAVRCAAAIAIFFFRFFSRCLNPISSPSACRGGARRGVRPSSGFLLVFCLLRATSGTHTDGLDSMPRTARWRLPVTCACRSRRVARNDTPARGVRGDGVGLPTVACAQVRLLLGARGRGGIQHSRASFLPASPQQWGAAGCTVSAPECRDTVVMSSLSEGRPRQGGPRQLWKHAPAASPHDGCRRTSTTRRTALGAAERDTVPEFGIYALSMDTHSGIGAHAKAKTK
ncbi:MAG: hypothetical protein JWN65_4208 [Solirubrobacterales bacterium]|nr:hypothetical protein [Solirubrobacterales bacterium]